MEKFKEYVLEELGIEEVSDEALIELYNALGTENIEKLYSKEYRLLSEYDFLDYYGDNSDVFVSDFDCEHWFLIVMYKNIYR